MIWYGTRTGRWWGLGPDRLIEGHSRAEVAAALQTAYARSPWPAFHPRRPGAVVRPAPSRSADDCPHEAVAGRLRRDRYTRTVMALPPFESVNSHS